MILLAPILLPLLGGILLLLPSTYPLKRFSITVLALTTLLMGGCVLFYDSLSIQIPLPFDLMLSFELDGISLVFSTVFAVVWWVVLLESFSFFNKPEPIFYSYYLGVFGALLGACYSHNLITFYIFFELAGMLCFPLVAYEQEDYHIKASKKYLFYSMGGAFLGLASIIYFYSLDLPYAFTAGGIQELSQVANIHELLGFTLLAVVGFGCKAGLFPLHGWLKDADPAAPTPASAVLSGVNTKLGILAILRIAYYVVGPDLLRGTFVQQWGISLAMLTIFIGSILALRERQLRTRLAYSTISQVAYIVFALFVFQEYAFVGAMMHLASHALAKSLLFLCAGQFIRQTEQTQVEPLQIFPFNPTYRLFAIGSMSLVGIPFTGGFIGKWYMGIGALAEGHFWGVAMLILSAIFTAQYLFPLVIGSFFTEKAPSWSKAFSHHGEETLSKERYAPILALLLLVLGIYPLPVLEILFALAQQLL